MREGYARFEVWTQPGTEPLVGRELESAHLERALNALDRGEAVCLTVEGEAGIGKTRLLAALRARAETRGDLVLSGAAAEFERELPFSVFIDALDAYAESHALREHPAWDAELDRELAEVLPSLRRSGHDIAVAEERHRSHLAVRRLLGLLAEDRPLVVVLDDLHWSDPASAELLAALVRRPPAAPVLLALGLRPRPVVERLAAALGRPSVTRLELSELGEQEAAELLAGVGADSDAIAAIYRHAGGNPFYLEQLGRSPEAPVLHMARDGERGVGPEVPPAVSAAIAEELGSLSEPTRRFLEAAAVAGEPFDPDLAAEIAGMPYTAGLLALDDLLGCDLARTTSVPRRFRFRHPLVRRAVYASTPAGWRLTAHARAADTLAARGAGVAERAHHVAQSARQGDGAAIELLLEAGHGAAGRAPAAAARWLDAALRLLPDGDRERQVDVRVALASAQRSLGELARCRTTLLEAIQRLSPEQAMRKVELTAYCAAVEHWEGRHEEAHSRLASAWESLPEHGTREAAALAVELAVDGLYTNDFARTAQMGGAALATARALGDDALIAVAAAALALGEAASSRTQAAQRHRSDALAHIALLDDAELAARLEMLYYLGWAENYLEHYDDAIAHAERGIAIARATGEGRLLVPLMLMRCYPLEMQGRLAEATRICEEAVEIARLSASAHLLFWALYELAWARYFAGDLAGTVAAGEESMAVGGRTWGGTMPSAGGGPGWALAVARFELGEVAQARALMLETGGADMEHWIPAERFFNWENHALVELALGHAERAEEIAARAEQSAAGVPLQLPATLAGRTRAAVALAAGDAAGAARAAEASIAAGTAIGASLQVAYSRVLLGRALAAAGDRPAAIEALREAERELSACGSARMRDEARRELRRLGARAQLRSAAGGEDSGLGSLTGREREIGELITERLTNKEIAGRLFLSEKTVESHVRNVLHKLGVSSRVEVARMIERERQAT